MKDRVWIAAVTAMLLLAGCTTNLVGAVNIYNPPAAHPSYAPPWQWPTAFAPCASREEAALIKTSGTPQPCQPAYALRSSRSTAAGMIDGALQIGCSTPSLTDTMQRAIQAQAPYKVPVGAEHAAYLGVYVRSGAWGEARLAKGPTRSIRRHSLKPVCSQNKRA